MTPFQQARTVDRREAAGRAEAPPPGRGSDYAELSRRVKRAGLLVSRVRDWL
jgi:hypothetical protein